MYSIYNNIHTDTPELKPASVVERNTGNTMKNMLYALISRSKQIKCY